MPEYRLYHFKHGHIHRADTLTAADDADAVELAAAKGDGETTELWRGARRIKTFNPSDA